MRINKISGNDCGGFKPPKGHMDSQMYPECEGKETDRNIVKKTVERRKKHKKNQKKNSFNLKEYKSANSANFTDDTGSRVEGVDAGSIVPTKIEIVKEWLEKKHPHINWTLESVKSWMNKNFMGNPSPLKDPQDIEHHF